jgi:hypothetical protein
MGQSNAFQAWRRHKVLATLLLLLAAAATAAAAVDGPRTYQSQGSVVLLASRAVAKPAGNNPYLSFSGSLMLTADVLSRELMAPETASALAARGFSDPYTVALATYTTPTTGSVLTVTVTGHGRAAAERELGAVMSEIADKLAGLQTGIKPYNRIRIVTIAKSRQATLSISSTARPLTLVAAGGLLLVFGLPWLVDAQLIARRTRRARRAAERLTAEELDGGELARSR